MLSYVPKKNKIVIMVSTMHHEDAIDSQKQIPEIISFYNSSKGGVDSLMKSAPNTLAPGVPDDGHW